LRPLVIPMEMLLRYYFCTWCHKAKCRKERIVTWDTLVVLKACYRYLHPQRNYRPESRAWWPDRVQSTAGTIWGHLTTFTSSTSRIKYGEISEKWLIVRIWANKHLVTVTATVLAKPCCKQLFHVSVQVLLSSHIQMPFKWLEDSQSLPWNCHVTHMPSCLPMPVWTHRYEAFIAPYTLSLNWRHI
jgi:hypothetical protein